MTLAILTSFICSFRTNVDSLTEGKHTIGHFLHLLFANQMLFHIRYTNVGAIFKQILHCTKYCSYFDIVHLIDNIFKQILNPSSPVEGWTTEALFQNVKQNTDFHEMHTLDAEYIIYT